MESNEKDQKILQLIRYKGPLLPVHIVKEVGWNTILVGAALSDLSNKGQIKMSYAKIGGSPVYYVQGQEQKLQNLYKYLHEKEQKAFDLLKEKKVLRDKELEPVIRVALRNIKDFAKGLEVTTNENKEIFWKWYLLSNQEAEQIIKDMLKITESKKKAEIKKEQEQKEKPEKEKPEKEKHEIGETSSFLKKIKDYFSKNNIKIKDQNIVRKTSDVEFIINVPSSIGPVPYFCKARSKKKINDSDLSNAYVQGQVKKLPVLLLITGELTKKAESLLDEQFKNLVIKKI